jgi:lipopolysaccharide/colanic/teichoic acid biosynthesis glycosyltransferase
VPPDPRPRPARAIKRGLDVAGALTLTVISAPLTALACAAIRIESPGSPIYRQRRVGKQGAPFDLYKLRTMVSGAEGLGAGLAVDEGDPRITRVGAILRRFSLDELPNLLNVLRGDMSLVGPRPTVQVQVAQYTERQRKRLAVDPGITGWAQVKGRAALPWHERIELDLWYIEHWSLRLDLEILASTARLLATGKGLYRGTTGGWRPPADVATRETDRRQPGVER